MNRNPSTALLLSWTLSGSHTLSKLHSTTKVARLQCIRFPGAYRLRKQPLATVDVAVFTVADEALQVLLVQRPQRVGEPFPGLWALPGGFVDVERDADLEACALRKLREKTGVSTPYLEQLGSWGSARRDPRGWSATHAYFALVPHETARAGANAADVRWFPVTGTGVRTRLAFDHAEILAAAIARLRGKVEYTSLPAF